MSSYFKTSGKKIKLPDPGSVIWKFENRPGGWVIAEGTIEKKGLKPQKIRKKIFIAEHRRQLSAQTPGGTWLGEILDESSSQGGVSGGSESDLIAQFPGKVRKIRVQSNQRVQQGEVLILLEAMKMEFAIRAPSDGTVLRLRVSEGEQVSPGTLLLDWEGSKDES